MWERKEETTPQQPSTPAARQPVASETMERVQTAQARIGQSLKLKGDITGNEDLYIDGEVEGKIELKDNSLTIGPNGKVHADVSARSITILGKLQGSIRVADRTEIRKTGTLEGDLVTARIVVEEGAMFRGTVDIIKTGEQADTLPKKKPVSETKPAMVGKPESTGANSGAHAQA